MTIYRAQHTDIDHALGDEKEITLREWFDLINQPYYHYNRWGESKKGVDFDLYDNSKNLMILSSVIGRVCCEAVRLTRSTLEIGKLGFRISEIEKHLHSSLPIWYVQVWEDDSKIYFESIEKLNEYLKDIRKYQEEGIFKNPRPTRKDEREERFLDIPLGSLQYRKIGGKNVDYKSICE